MCLDHIRANDVVAVYRNLRHKNNLKSNEELKNEMRKAYVCQRCGRGFAYPRGLYRHKKYTCDVEAKFTCDLCSYKSKYKSDVITHMRNIHLKKKQHVENTDVNQKKLESRHECNKCGRSYAHQKSLIFHIRHVCGVERKFECDFCGYKTKYKRHLLAHIQRIHFKNR